MPNSLSHRQLFSRSLAALALVALGAGLSGCAGMSDTISPAFADPAKYDLYDCKQLETERKSLAARTAELQGLMTKAETGVAGSVVAEMAYRNDYIALRGQSKLAEEAWQKNRCQDVEAGSQAGAGPAIDRVGSRQGQAFEGQRCGKLKDRSPDGAERNPGTVSPADGLIRATGIPAHTRQS